ncbi:MAG: hypothetical protein HOD54_04725 [Candidatus Magasanikbacteria bacterium]|nr:hypothetical protein [Candidatus Magasanikbacteria bacterium]MBT4547226.1 hypothetical protein [Candidatus Magasanikbacteria bacterium]
MARPMVLKKTWWRSYLVRSTGDSRLKAKKRGNKRRQKRVNRQRQFNEDRRSGAAQKRRELLYMYQAREMEKARKKSVFQFFERLANPAIQSISPRERYRREEQARQRRIAEERETKRQRALVEERRRRERIFYPTRIDRTHGSW